MGSMMSKLMAANHFSHFFRDDVPVVMTFCTRPARVAAVFRNDFSATGL